MVETLLSGGVLACLGAAFAAGLAGIGSAVGSRYSRSGSGRRCF